MLLIMMLFCTGAFIIVLIFFCWDYFVITYLSLGYDLRALVPWDSSLWSNRISFVLRYGYHMSYRSRNYFDDDEGLVQVNVNITILDAHHFVTEA